MTPKKAFGYLMALILCLGTMVGMIIYLINR